MPLWRARVVGSSPTDGRNYTKPSSLATHTAFYFIAEKKYQKLTVRTYDLSRRQVHFFKIKFNQCHVLISVSRTKIPITSSRIFGFCVLVVLSFGRPLNCGTEENTNLISR